MRKALALTLVLILMTGIVSGATFGDSFQVDLTVKNNGDIEIDSFSITRAERSPEQTGNYSLTFEDSQNNTVYSYKFSPEFTTSGHTVGSGDQLNQTGSTVRERKMSFWLPYNKTSTEILGKYGKEVVSEVSITEKLCQNFDNKCSSYCKGKGIDVDCTCGDNICQKSTNEQELCPKDCSDPEKSRPENQTPKQEQTKEIVDSSYSNYILMTVILAAVLIGLFMLSGKVKIEA